MEESTERIDLNHASIDVLSTIPGIGPKLAARIVDYREGVHPFEEIIELAAVPGISESMVRSIEEHITITPFSESGAEAEPDRRISEPNEGTAEEVEEGAAAEDEADALHPDPEPEDEDEDVVPIVLWSRDSSDEAMGEGVHSLELEAAEEEAQVAVERPQDEEPTAEVAEGAGLEAEEPAVGAPEPAVAESVEGQLMAVSPDARPYRVAEAPVATGSGRWIAAAISGAIFGALVGALVTLLTLFLLNDRTLRFASATTAGDLREEIGVEADSAQRERATLADRLGHLVEQAESLSADSESLDQELQALGRSLAAIETDVDDLQDTAGELSTRIDTVAAAAEDFDAFLIGLQELLVQLRGTDGDTTAAPEVMPTPSVPAAGAEEEAATPSPTAVAQPTRTPRPTATPFTVPGATPSPEER